MIDLKKLGLLPLFAARPFVDVYSIKHTVSCWYKKSWFTDVRNLSTTKFIFRGSIYVMWYKNVGDTVFCEHHSSSSVDGMSSSACDGGKKRGAIELRCGPDPFSVIRTGAEMVAPSGGC
jgi:hypothetical protein